MAKMCLFCIVFPNGCHPNHAFQRILLLGEKRHGLSSRVELLDGVCLLFCFSCWVNVTVFYSLSQSLVHQNIACVLIETIIACNPIQLNNHQPPMLSNSFFHSSHKYFCYFSFVQRCIMPWMSLRRDCLKVCIVIPIWANTVYHPINTFAFRIIWT